MAQAIPSTSIIVPFPGHAMQDSRPESGSRNVWPPQVRMACLVGAAITAWAVVIAPAAFLL